MPKTLGATLEYTGTGFIGTNTALTASVTLDYFRRL